MLYLPKYTLLLILLLGYGPAQSQTVVWAKKANAAVAGANRLIVLQLDSTDLPDVKKFKKRADLIKAYGKYTREFNEMIQAPIRAHWHLFKQVDFMTVREYKTFRSTASGKDKKAALVLLFESPEYQFMNALEKLGPAALEHLDFDKVRVDDDYIQPISLFDVETVRPFDENEIAAAPSTALARVEVNGWHLNASDIVFAIESMQVSIRATAQEGNVFLYCINVFDEDKGKLANKTLLIPEAYTVKASTGKKTILDAELKKIYTWPWRFASSKEINEAIEKKDPNVAVLVSSTNLIANNNGGIYFWVLDAADGRSILGYSTPGNKNLGLATYQKEGELYDLNERRLQEIITNAKKP